MKKFLSTICFILLFLVSHAQQTEIPAALKPFVKTGYEVLDFAKQDMNGDKLADYILILKKAGEDTITFDNAEWNAVRPIMLIVNQPGGKLEKIAENNELILCRNCGGAMGDPYQGITTKPGEFTVDFYGGSSWRWSDQYLFRYDKVKKNWFMETQAMSSMHVADPDAKEETTLIKRVETGDISLQGFSLYYNSDSSVYKVNTTKTYFYPSPDLKAKPKRAYLVKGDTVLSTKYFKNFVQCAFTNNKNETTYGYILKKDLVLINAGKPAAVQ